MIIKNLNRSKLKNLCISFWTTVWIQSILYLKETDSKLDMIYKKKIGGI